MCFLFSSLFSLFPCVAQQASLLLEGPEGGPGAHPCCQSGILFGQPMQDVAGENSGSEGPSALVVSPR